jgi:hypothetical protein
VKFINTAIMTVMASVPLAAQCAEQHHFNRVASFPICTQLEENCNIDDETAAEIVAAGPLGRILIYTDSPRSSLGFVSIADPSSPQGIGTLTLEGEPTSVAVKGLYSLVAVNTSADFVNPSGHLFVVNIFSQRVVHRIDLGGQPDSVAISPDKKYAAVVIENERDEDLGNGEPPQLPAGKLVIVNMADKNPKKWVATTVDLSGLAQLFAGDPEPEYVDINQDNIAVVTLQENNHLVLVDLETSEALEHFSAGSVNLTHVDNTEEDPSIISLTETLAAVPREPDGVVWTSENYFATADEGDLNGGSRGFTIFGKDGSIVYTSGNWLEHLTTRLGHYPDRRSGNKGNEPENVTVGQYGDETLLFVNSERSSLVFVYNVNNPSSSILRQILPTGVAPEGGLTIAKRNLLIVSSEEDNRGDKIRSVLNIYERQTGPANYPTLQSVDRVDGTPIPWGALSGLAADPDSTDVLYSI